MIRQQLYIDGILADVDDNTKVSYTIKSNLLSGAADFVGNRTLTVTLPATVHNRTLIEQSQVVQGGSEYPYRFHNVDYYRNGVQLISGGIGRLVSTTPDELHIAIVWGVRTSVDALLVAEDTLSDLETPAYIEFNAEPQVTPYADALVDDVFYAALDCALHEGENDFYHTHVIIGGEAYDYREGAPASPYLHPSVRMIWILDLVENKYGTIINWDDAMDDIGTMIVPLVKKVPNDTTYNGGFRASTSEPGTMGGIAGNFIQFKTVHNSAIIAEKDTDPQSIKLTCETAFTGLVKYQLVMYINEADLIRNYPIYRARYGYSLGLRIGSDWHWCTILPEGTTFLADKVVAGKLNIYATGYLHVDMAVNDEIYLRIGCTSNGVFDPEIESDLHVTGGPLWVSEIIGKEGEVQPGQYYPVEGNLPEIKPIDLIKFLSAVTGYFPLQSSTSARLEMAPVSKVFDFSERVDWSRRLLSTTSRPVAAGQDFSVNGWCKHNVWKWKDDETVAGNYDGSIDVDDETLDDSRVVFEFPFAATDGNNVPLYATEYKQGGIPERKYKEVKPRVLSIMQGDNSEAVGYFDIDMKRIISDYYGDLAATMEHPVVITETFRMGDVDIAKVDESRPIYLRQHGAYFALLELKVKGDGTAEAKLLKLKKQEEQ